MHWPLRTVVPISLAGLMLWVCVGVQSTVTAQTRQAAAAELEVLQLRPNFFLIAGAGGHIGVQVGDDGVVLVDSGSSARSDAVLAAIKKLTPQPIRYIISTSADADHVGGNEALSKAGQTLFTAPGSIALPGNYLGGAASILAAEGVLTRMSASTGQAPPFPAAALPTETFDLPRKYLYLNGEGIEVLHQPAAHCCLKPGRHPAINEAAVIE